MVRDTFPTHQPYGILSDFNLFKGRVVMIGEVDVDLPKRSCLDLHVSDSMAHLPKQQIQGPALPEAPKRVVNRLERHD